jgi:hypothetical protein
MTRRPPLPALALLVAGCGEGLQEPAPDPCTGTGALSTCSTPSASDTHYIEQGERYFDTLDASADPGSEPDYAETVARWEWPPWLLLTGWGKDFTLAADEVILAAYPGTTVPFRDCRAFSVQPFGRCRVTIDYEGKPCPIYEEFTFNDDGLVTFVEAWSDQPELLPMDASIDTWAEGNAVSRLSTRVPGLGTAGGAIDPTGKDMEKAAATDPELADFAARTQDFWGYWAEAYAAAGDDMFARGCGW